MVIPNTWTWTWTWTWSWTWSVMNLINLVSRLIFDTKLKTSLPVIWLDWKIRVGPSQRTRTQLILVPGWSGRWWRRSSTNWSSNLTMRSKETGIISHSSIDWSSLSYFTLAWQSNAIFYQLICWIFNVITDYLPFVN